MRASMASAAPRKFRPAMGMNRWTFEPVLLALLWISTLTSALVTFAFVGGGFEAAIAVVAVILLWSMTALVWEWIRRGRAPH